MVTITVTKQQLNQQTVDSYAIVCPQDFIVKQSEAASLVEFYSPLETALQQRNFTGAAGTSCVLTGSHKNKPVYLIFVGIGSSQKKQEDRLENYRRALGNILRTAGL